MNWIFDLLHAVGGENLIGGFAALSAFFVVTSIWRALLLRDPMVARLKRLEARRVGLREEMLKTRPNETKSRIRHMQHIRGIVSRCNLLRDNVTGKAVALLERAGMRSRDALIVYMFLKLVLPLIAALFTLGFLVILNVYGMPPHIRGIISVLVVLITAYAPDLYLKNLISKRRVKLENSAPDALDLMVICTEAGLSLDATLARVAKELGRSNPELGDELSLTSIELGLLPERAKALENLARRCGVNSIRNLITTLAQTEKFGTPLADGLRVLADESRNERMMRAETKAARLPATLTVPMVLFIMPALFVVLLGPAILRTIDNLSRF